MSLSSPRFAKSLRKLLSNEKGNVTMTLAIASIPLVASVGLAVDYVRASRAAQELQQAADGAMLAAASAKNVSGTDAEKITKRTTIATNYLNAAIPKVQDATLVGTPNVVATANSINVAIRATVKGTFINSLKAIKQDAAVIGGDVKDGSDAGMAVDIDVASKAKWTDGKAYVCILALNPTIANAISVQGTADINTKGCSVRSNSNSATSLYMNGTAKITAPAISVVGSYSAPGGAFGNATPKTGVTAFADPLKTQYTADFNANYPNAPVGYPNNSKSPLSFAKGTDVMAPGTYNSGVSISGTTVTMAPGIYYMVNGPFQVKSGGTAIGNGVTIVLVGSGALLDIQAQGNLQISAPKTGPFAGIAVAQDPGVTLKNNQKNSVIGGGSISIDGAMYFPSKDFYVTGNGTTVSDIATTNSQFAIIADTVTVQGNGQVNVGGGADYIASGLPALPASSQGASVVSLSH